MELARRMPGRAHIAVALFGIVLAAAGCGSGGSTNSTGSAGSSAVATSAAASSPATATMIASADAICRRVNAQIAAVKPNSTSMREIVRDAPRNAGLELQALGELAKLKAPAGVAGEWSQILAYRRTLANELRQLLEAARRKDAASVKALGASKKHTHQALLAAAGRAGFNDCGQVG